jgi:hypothetical protein
LATYTPKDPASLFLTANSDTIYFWSFVDLTDSPMVIDVPVMPAPSAILGTIDDLWFRWVTDLGLPGPDRGEGGKYLLVGLAMTGRCPRAASMCPRSRTTRACLIGRAFMVDNDPAPAVEAIKQGFRIYPYTPERPAPRWPAFWPDGRRSPVRPRPARRGSSTPCTWR